jgi:hypothetical protein
MVATQSGDTRARVIRFFTFLGGIYFFVYFVLPEPLVEELGMKAHHEQISNGFIVVGSMAIGLGLFNLVRTHGARCVFARPGWMNSLSLLLGLFVTVGVMSLQWIHSMKSSGEVQDVQMIGEFASKIGDDARGKSGIVDPSTGVVLREYASQKLGKIALHIAGDQEIVADVAHEVLRKDLASRIEDLRKDEWYLGTSSDLSALTLFTQKSNELASSYSVLMQAEASQATIQRLYNFLYDGLFNQLGSAMFALLGVYIAAAAYRAFRVRTLESALMMTAAVVVMLGQISFGKEIYEEMPAIRQWLLEVPNSAAFRAIRLGAGIAGLMLAIRMWLSIESTSFSSEKK